MRWLIYCHGWASAPAFWQKLQWALAAKDPKLKYSYINLGYFGAKDLELPNSLLTDPTIKIFGIGHSLGLSKLLTLTPAVTFTGLIGLQSFSNFLGYAESLRVTRSRQLKYLITKFNKDPLAALKIFYRNAGLRSEIDLSCIKVINFAQLASDLLDLDKLDQPLPAAVPGLIIGTKYDQIVPPELIFDNFSQHQQFELEILAGSNHTLGMDYVDLLVPKITKFLYANS